MNKFIAIVLTTLLSITSLSSAFGNDCVYSPSVINSIASGMRFPDAAINTKQSVAFRSKDFKQLYFIAARINSESFEKSIGIWTVNDLESGMIFTANTDASITTVFPNGTKGGPKITESDHGYSEVMECFNKKFKRK